MDSEKQEAILLDLLRVIGHHRARLATPVRTLQKIYNDADLDNIPYADSTFSGAGTVPKRPLLVIEPSYKINADDKTKTRPARANVDQDNKTSNSDTSGNTKTVVTPKSDPEKSDSSKSNVEIPEISSNSKANVLVADNSPQNQKDIHVKQPKDQNIKNIKPDTNTDNVVSSSSNADKTGGIPTNLATKQQGEKKPATQSHASRPVLEENIVLGVALEGSKRTLPIDEEIETVTTQETKEMAATASPAGNGSPRSVDGNES